MTDSQRESPGPEEPHDILAAEEFAIPQPDPGVPHDLDPDPHDVLAAEEFAFPAPGDRAAGPKRSGSLPWAAGMAGAAVARADAEGAIDLDPDPVLRRELFGHYL
jgi:hypothetical protein